MAHQTLTIRTALPEDYAAIESLFRQLDALHLDIVPAVFRPFAGPSRTVECVRRIIESDDSDLIVAECDGRVVGLLHITKSMPPQVPMFRAEPFAAIDAIIVDESSRRRGIGAALLKEAGRWANRRKLTAVQLMVWEGNTAALAFYRKAGFHTMMARLEATPADLDLLP
jgi:ribosomal protein S18 acetylase RimI-like enzyme